MLFFNQTKNKRQLRSPSGGFLYSRKNKSKNRKFILLSIFILTVSVFTPLFSTPASAKIDSATPDQQAQSTTYYNLLRRCVSDNMKGTISLTASDDGVATPSTWFDDNAAYGYAYPAGKIDCKNVVDPALSLWGWGNNYSQFLQDIGYTFDASKPEWYGPNNRSDGQNRRNYFDSAVQKKYYTTNFSGNATPSGEASYLIYLNAFLKACNAKDLGLVSSITNTSYLNWLNSSASNAGREVSSQTANISGMQNGPNINVYFSKVNKVDTVPVVENGVTNNTYEVKQHGFVYQTVTYGGDSWYGAGNAPLDTDKVKVYGYHDGSVENSCNEIQKLVSDNAGAFRTWTRNHPEKAIENPDTNAGTPGSTDVKPSCGGLVQGIGWIVCPILDALGGMNDAMWGFVSGLLTVDPLQQNGTMYDLWQKLQAIANVLLVIVFLFIIFSQLTGAGISNYGIKKMLPRLVIIAIAINLSYFLISVAVDVFNIIGTSIYNILNGLADQSKQPPSWEGLIGLIVGAGAGGAIAVGLLASSGGITAALLLLLPLALAAAIGFLVAVVTLLLRQALIPLLAVLAPVAFVMYLLPNTNQWFTKWRKTFISMLLLFPIAAFLFGGLKLAAIAIAGDSANWLSSLTALVVMAVPLFTLPYIARQAGPVLGKIGNNLNGMAKKLQNPVAGWSKSQAGLRAARNDLKPTSRFNIPGRIRQNIQMRNKRRDLEANAYKAQGEANYNEKLIEHADDWATGVDGSAAQAYIRGAGARAQAEEMKAAQIPLTQEVAAVRAKGGDVDKFLESRALDSSRSNTEREAAIHQAAALGRDAVVRKFLGNTSVDQSAVQRAITANAGSLSGKAPDLVKGAGPAFSGFSGQDMSQWSKSTAEAYIKHIKNLQNTGKTAEASKALADFASAARDIQANPNLQGVFSSDTGNEIKSQAAQLEASDPVKFAGIAGAFGAIGPDGKIR